MVASTTGVTHPAMPPSTPVATPIAAHVSSTLVESELRAAICSGYRPSPARSGASHGAATSCCGGAQRPPDIEVSAEPVLVVSVADGCESIDLRARRLCKLGGTGRGAHG